MGNRAKLKVFMYIDPRDNKGIFTHIAEHYLH